jgi:hypothetical protein
MAFDHLRVVLADRLEKQLLSPNGEQRPKLIERTANSSWHSCYLRLAEQG